MRFIPNKEVEIYFSDTAKLVRFGIFDLLWGA